MLYNRTKEEIPTGITVNYVPHWKTWEAVREIAQNMAFTKLKGGDVEYRYTEDGYAILEDNYTGIEKKHLYIGEGEQRTDELGLGYFGEGLKMALLVFARNDISHRIDTVGYSFWGEIKETEHETQALVIKTRENDREKGTKISMVIPKGMFEKISEGFAPLIGLNSSEETIFKGRYNELWVRGVKIQAREDPNPYEVYFSYNLMDKRLTNRDRTILDKRATAEHIRRIVFFADPNFVKQFIEVARNSENHGFADIALGPYSPTGNETKDWMKWRKALSEVYRVNFDHLVWPSGIAKIDSIVESWGYKLLTDLPNDWYSELINYAKVKKAEELVSTKPQIKEITPSKEDKELLKRAKLKARKCFRLASVKEFPEIRFAEEIMVFKTDPGVKRGCYDKKNNVIYLSKEAFSSEKTLFKVLLHELIHWHTGALDGEMAFYREYENIVERLIH